MPERYSTMYINKDLELFKKGEPVYIEPLKPFVMSFLTGRSSVVPPKDMKKNKPRQKFFVGDKVHYMLKAYISFNVMRNWPEYVARRFGIVEQVLTNNAGVTYMIMARTPEGETLKAAPKYFFNLSGIGLGDLHDEYFPNARNFKYAKDDALL